MQAPLDTFLMLIWVWTHEKLGMGEYDAWNEEEWASYVLRFFNSVAKKDREEDKES